MQWKWHYTTKSQHLFIQHLRQNFISYLKLDINMCLPMKRNVIPKSVSATQLLLGQPYERVNKENGKLEFNFNLYDNLPKLRKK